MYLHDLMTDILGNNSIKNQFINQFIKEANIKGSNIANLVYAYLNSIEDNEKLVRKTMSGIRKDEIEKKYIHIIYSIFIKNFQILKDGMIEIMSFLLKVETF